MISVKVEQQRVRPGPRFYLYFDTDDENIVHQWLNKHRYDKLEDYTYIQYIPSSTRYFGVISPENIFIYIE